MKFHSFATRGLWITALKMALSFWLQETFHRLTFSGEWKWFCVNDCVDISGYTCPRCKPWTCHSLNDEQCSGRPQTATDQAHQNRVDEMIKGSWRVTHQSAANKIFVSYEPVQAIIADFGYRKLCSLWAVRTVTEDQKQKQMDIYRQMLLQYVREE
jgi:hypothetical protein